MNKTGSGMTMDIALGVVGAIVGGINASFFGTTGVTGLNVTTPGQEILDVAQRQRYFTYITTRRITSGELLK